MMMQMRTQGWVLFWCCLQTCLAQFGVVEQCSGVCLMLTAQQNCTDTVDGGPLVSEVCPECCVCGITDAELDAQRLETVQGYIEMSAWLDPTANVEQWKADLRSLTHPNITQIIPSTGTWTGEDFIEYMLLANPLFSFLQTQWTLREIILDTLVDNQSTLSFYTADNVTLLASNTAVYSTDSYHEIRFEECGSRILEYLHELPAWIRAFENFIDGGALLFNYTDFCELIDLTCGVQAAAFPSREACVSFFEQDINGQDFCIGQGLLGNSYTCRFHYLTNAFLDPITHCPYLAPDSPNCLDTQCPGSAYLTRDSVVAIFGQDAVVRSDDSCPAQAHRTTACAATSKYDNATCYDALLSMFDLGCWEPQLSHDLMIYYPSLTSLCSVDDALLRSDICPTLVLPDTSSPVLDAIKCLATDLPTTCSVDSDCPTILVCDSSSALCVEPPLPRL